MKNRILHKLLLLLLLAALLSGCAATKKLPKMPELPPFPHPTDTPVAVHVTCSMRLMGLKDVIIGLAKKCSTQVYVPEEIGCCAFAGDKGMTHPKLNAYALRKLKPYLQKHGVKEGYSNSRTCEIGLTTNGGITYRSIVYLVNACTTPAF